MTITVPGEMKDAACEAVRKARSAGADNELYFGLVAAQAALAWLDSKIVAMTCVYPGPRAEGFDLAIQTVRRIYAAPEPKNGEWVPMVPRNCPTCDTQGRMTMFDGSRPKFCSDCGTALSEEKARHAWIKPGVMLSDGDMVLAVHPRGVVTTRDGKLLAFSALKPMAVPGPDEPIKDLKWNLDCASRTALDALWARL